MYFSIYIIYNYIEIVLFINIYNINRYPNSVLLTGCPIIKIAFYKSYLYKKLYYIKTKTL